MSIGEQKGPIPPIVASGAVPRTGTLSAQPGLVSQLLPRSRRRWHWVAWALVAVVVLLVGSTFVSLPYYVESPGVASPFTVQVRGKDVPGGLLFTTVALTDHVDPLEFLTASFNSNDHLVARRDLTGGVTQAEFAQENAAAMDASKQDAIIVALRRLGYTVPEHGDGALVVDVVPGTPAANRLRPGDVIVAVDKHPITLTDDLTAIIRQHHPGDLLQVTIRRPNAAASPSHSAQNGPNAQNTPSNETASPPVGPTQTLSVPLAACPGVSFGCAGPGGERPFLGVTVQTSDDHFDYPFSVNVPLSGVGGPSAGLAFTLGIINAMTGGHLMGRHRVAVTGEIEPDGTVGAVGGVALKTVAVERAGADVFLVPKDDGVSEPQYSDALSKARGHHLDVIGVGTLEDALNALRSLGGDLSRLGPPPPSLER